jgi:hypothetical protein
LEEAHLPRLFLLVYLPHAAARLHSPALGTATPATGGDPGLLPTAAPALSPNARNEATAPALLLQRMNRM